MGSEMCIRDSSYDWFLSWHTGVPGQKPIIGEVDQQSIAWKANIRAGDEIISVGEREVKTWQSALISMIGEVLEDEQISIQLINANGSKKNVLLDVSGRTKELTSPDLLFPGLGFTPKSPNLKPIVVSVVPDSPADQSGLKKDDILKSIDGIQIQNIEQFSQLIMDRPNALINLLIERDGMGYETDVSLTTREDNKSMGYIGLQTTFDQDQLQEYMAIEKYLSLIHI